MPMTNPRGAGAVSATSTGVATERRIRLPRRVSLTAVRSRLFTPEGGAFAITLLFMLISAWWLSQDRSVPSGDPGKHLAYAFQNYDYLRNGLLWEAFKNADSKYPPLVHIIGGLMLNFGGLGVGRATLALNLVFVPALAIGVFGTGKLVAGPRVGLYALLFALASPMAISQFHVFMLDMPLASMVALTVFLLLKSDYFRIRRYAILAGVAAGLGVLVKESFAYWLIGVVVVMVIRGGWRNWVGLGLSGIFAFGVGLPWYIVKRDDLSQTAQIARDFARNNDPTRGYDVYSLTNFAWWFWALTFVVLLVPMTVYFFGGTIDAIVRKVRRLETPRYVPELLAGAAVGFVITALTLTPDQRYILPGLVFMAVLGTAWLAHAVRPLRIAGVAILVAVFAANTVMTNFGPREHVRFLIDGLPYGNARSLTFLSGYGFAWTNQPFDGRMLDMLQAGRARGATQFAMDPAMANDNQFTISGLASMARTVGISLAPNNDPNRLRPNDLYIHYGSPEDQATKPICARGGIDNTPVYVSNWPGLPSECPPGYRLPDQ